MKKIWKILMLVLAVLPILYIFYFIYFVFSLIFTAVVNDQPDFEVMKFASIFVMHFLTIFLIIGLYVWYLVHLFNNPKLKDDKDKKILRLCLIIFGSLIAMIVYWFIYVRKELEEDKAGILEGKK